MTSFDHLTLNSGTPAINTRKEVPRLPAGMQGDSQQDAFLTEPKYAIPAIGQYATKWQNPQPRRPPTKVEDMRNIPIRIERDGPRISVRETETPGTWELEWTGDIEQRHARRMLKAAENAVLRNGGERILLTCSADQEILSAELDKRPPSIVSRSGDRCAMELITPGDDGFIHDDDDFRTPLERITCPTCVERFARSRTTHRQDAFGKQEGPKEIAKHSRLIAEAYTRLAEIEENLENGGAEPVPGGTDAEWAEEDERIASL